MCDFTKNSNFNKINHKNKSFYCFITKQDSMLINRDCGVGAR